MAKKYSELPAATLPLAKTDKAAIVQSGVSKQVDVSNLSLKALEGSTNGNLTRSFTVRLTRDSAGATSKAQIFTPSGGGAGFNHGGKLNTTLSASIANGGNASVGTAGVDKVTFAINAGGNTLTLTFDNGETITNLTTAVYSASSTGLDFYPKIDQAGSTLVLSFRDNLYAAVDFNAIAVNKFIEARLEYIVGGV
ncbi:MAG: hypothetical protein OEY64_03320 [Nitrospinota bacterium]|nr:hypothetical protein [Nitrospinota bacterium]